MVTSAGDSLASMDAARKLATYDDLLALSEDVKGEIIHGALIVLPSVLPRHSNVQRGLGRFVGGPFHDDDGRGGPGGWWIFPEVDVRLSAHEIVRPDMSGWRRERLHEPWDKRPIDVCPDWVCEVLSVSNTAHDRVTKRHLYARSGVPYYWIIDPVACTLEALQLRDGVWVDAGPYDHTAIVRVPPFEAIELELGRLFGPLPGPDP